MTWIKICGTTNLEDAKLAVDAGADAVGFVFYEKSPRNIEVHRAREIVRNLPDEIEKVGVFVNVSAEYVESVVRDAGLTAVQIYSGAGPALDLNPSDGLAIRNFRLIVALSSEQLTPGHIITGLFPGMMVYALLVDSGGNARPGGTGVRFNWLQNQEMIRSLGSLQKIIVAGGFTPANVGEGIAILQPWGVDVVSGVEERPGKKDPVKVHAFVKAVREADEMAS